MKDFKLNFWILLIILSGLFLILYGLGKVIGIIHSPILIEMLPFISAGIGILSTGIMLGETIQKVNMIDDIKKDIKMIGNSLINLGNDFKELKAEHKIMAKRT